MRKSSPVPQAMATTLGSRAAGTWGTLSVEKLTRRKHVSAPRRSGHQLAKHLTAAQLIPIGIGSTIGAGVYVLIGTVARERAGPSLTLSFLIAGIAAALSAFCYAELASRCPSAGSAYHYAYTCVGEGVAWIIGWGLVLEYTVGGSAVARGVSPNLATFFGGAENLPAIFMRREIPGIDVIADPLAGVIVIVVTVLLCIGIKESANFASVMVAGNICVLLFVIIAGAWAGFYNGWPGYEQVESYFPFGLNGTLGGAATLFFAFIGFDTVASTAEEVKHPQRDLPLGIGLALFICASLYMLVSTVIVGLVPYKLMDPDTPISSAFSDNGMPWAMFVVAAGAMAALCTTLMGSLLPQPRILMAMSRDGLLPPFLSNINKRTRVPVNGTILSGIVALLMAVFMDVDQLSGMVSIGTLLAFTIVGVAILILRYVPPTDDVPTRSGVPAPVIPASPSAALLSPRSVGNKSDAISAFPFFGTTRYFSPVMSFFSEASLQSLPGKDRGDVSSSSSDISVEDAISSDVDIEDHASPEETQQKSLLLIQEKATSDASKEERRRRAASIAISAVSAGVICISLATSADKLANWFRWTLGSVGLPIFVAGTIVLFLIDQDEERHSFGQTGGFICPFVPGLPIASILINVYLLVNLGVSTWVRVSIWLVIGVFIYVFYGVEHSVLGAGGSGITQESTESPALLDTDVLV